MPISRTVVAIVALVAACAPAVRADVFDTPPIHSFNTVNLGTNFYQGINPEGPMILASDGNFYGMTAAGGVITNTYGGGEGSIYKMAPDGTTTFLHYFGDGTVANDGVNGVKVVDTSMSLVEGTDHNFYGVTPRGGAYGYGTVFKMTPSGTVTILHSFNGSVDGSGPFCTLVQGGDGKLYGTTVGRGANNCGTVFSIDTAGTTFTDLHDFAFTDGESAQGTLVDGGDGYFYGATQYGGNTDVVSGLQISHGVIYKIAPNGDFAVVHARTTGEGLWGLTGLTKGNDGNFYGTCEGFQGHEAVLYKVTPSGTYTVVHTFANTTQDGGGPTSPLIKDANGTLYGTCMTGGVYGTGTIFTLDTSGNYATLMSYLQYQYGNGEQTWLSQGPSGQIFGVSYTDPVTHGIAFKLRDTSGTVGPTVRFTIEATTNQVSGAPFTFHVTARDQAGNATSDYTHLVHFSGGDAQAILPADTVITNSVGTFTATLHSDANLTVTDTSDASITGHTLIRVDPVLMTVVAPHVVTAGSAFTFNVVTLDGYTGSAAATFGEPISFGTNAPRATLPPTSTLTNGLGAFTATFTKAGTAAANFKISGRSASGYFVATSAAITVLPAAATGFSVSIPTTVESGHSFSGAVTAKDAFGNVATGYNGTVHFTSTDGRATLPANLTLSNGTGAFTATLIVPGSQRIYATDTVNAGVHGASNAASVLNATALLIRAPASVTVGVPFNINVTALNAYGHIVPGYSGTVKFYSNSTGATMPANSTLTSGAGTFSVTLNRTGTFKVSAVDTVAAGIHGTSASITSTP